RRRSDRASRAPRGAQPRARSPPDPTPAKNTRNLATCRLPFAGRIIAPGRPGENGSWAAAAHHEGSAAAGTASDGKGFVPYVILRTSRMHAAKNSRESQPERGAPYGFGARNTALDALRPPPRIKRPARSLPPTRTRPSRPGCAPRHRASAAPARLPFLRRDEGRGRESDRDAASAARPDAPVPQSNGLRTNSHEPPVRSP